MGSSITRAAAILLVSTLASRVTGLLRETLLAAQLGLGPEADAYAVAFMLPDLLNTLLAGGFLSLTVIPALSRLERSDPAAAARLLSVAVAVFVGAGVFLALVLGVFAPVLLPLVQPGLAGTPVLDRAVELVRIVLPAQIVFLASALWTGAQHARSRFLLAAGAPLVYNAGILCGGLLLGPWMGAEGFAWGVLAGAILGHGILQAAGLRRAGWPLWSSPDRQAWSNLVRLLHTTLPLMVGLTMGFSCEFLLRRLAGWLPPGEIAASQFAYRLLLFLVATTGHVIGVASYPRLVALRVEADHAGLSRLLGSLLRKSVAVLVPATVGLALLALPVSRLLLAHGAMTDADAKRVADHLVILVWAALPWALQVIAARTLYASGRFWSSALAGTLATLVSWPLWSFLIQIDPEHGLALGLVVFVWLQLLAQGIVAWRSLEPPASPDLRGLLRAAVPGLVALPVVALASKLLKPDLIVLATTAFALAASCLVVGRLLGVEPWNSLARRLVRIGRAPEHQND